MLELGPRGLEANALTCQAIGLDIVKVIKNYFKKLKEHIALAKNNVLLLGSESKSPLPRHKTLTMGLQPQFEFECQNKLLKKPRTNYVGNKFSPSLRVRMCRSLN